MNQEEYVFRWPIPAGRDIMKKNSRNKIVQRTAQALGQK